MLIEYININDSVSYVDEMLMKALLNSLLLITVIRSKMNSYTKTKSYPNVLF